MGEVEPALEARLLLGDLTQTELDRRSPSTICAPFVTESGGEIHLAVWAIDRFYGGGGGRLGQARVFNSLRSGIALTESNAVADAVRAAVPSLDWPREQPDSPIPPWTG